MNNTNMAVFEYHYFCAVMFGIVNRRISALNKTKTQEVGSLLNILIFSTSAALKNIIRNAHYEKNIVIFYRKKKNLGSFNSHRNSCVIY